MSAFSGNTLWGRHEYMFLFCHCSPSRHLHVSPGATLAYCSGRGRRTGSACSRGDGNIGDLPEIQAEERAGIRGWQRDCQVWSEERGERGNGQRWTGRRRRNGQQHQRAVQGQGLEVQQCSGGSRGRSHEEGERRPMFEKGEVSAA